MTVSARLTCPRRKPTLVRVNLERAQESLSAAQLCLRHGLLNSAASRAYYAMFQAAQVALKQVRVERPMWSHHGLQATFVAELIARRKAYPAGFRDYLTTALQVRLAADYGWGVSRKITQRLVRHAATLIAAVERQAAE